MGIYAFMKVDEKAIRAEMGRGVPAIVDELRRHGSEADLENLEYVLHGKAGESELRFQNGWMRDRAPDGSLLAERTVTEEGGHAAGGMRLHDFVMHPSAVDARLDEAHVLALRLYTTSVFRALNEPLRKLKRDDQGAVMQPPQLAEPHPLPVTVAFIYEGLKRMRALNVEAAERNASLRAMTRHKNGGPSELPTDELVHAITKRAGAEKGRAFGLAWRALGLMTGDRRARAPKGRPRPMGKMLFRGMKNLQVGAHFVRGGGSELASMSTTAELAIAARYSRGAAHALIFRIIATDFMNMGVSLCFLSAFPHEQEYLYPPLTFLKPTGKGAKLRYSGTCFEMLDVAPSFPS